MVREFKEGLFRLALGAILFFLLLGFYMRAVNIGAFYNSVDGYLIVLPIVRLASIVIAVAVLIALARPLSEVCIDAIAIIDKNLGWDKNDEGPKVYKDFAYYTLLMAFLVIGYFTIAPRLREAVTPMEGYGWMPVVFGLLWLLLALVVLAYIVMKARREYPLWRDWAEESKRRRMELKASRSLAHGAGEVKSPASRVSTVPGARTGMAGKEAKEVRKHCKHCGAELKEGAAFCGDCGKKVS